MSHVPDKLGSASCGAGDKMTCSVVLTLRYMVATFLKNDVQVCSGMC